MHRIRPSLIVVVVGALLTALATAAASSSLVPGKTLVEHWTGSKWGRVTSPTPNGSGVLFGIAALRANQVWAVGARGKNLASHPLIQRWDGSRWRSVSSRAGAGGSSLHGVAAFTSSTAWAVGSDGGGSPLIERWNGIRWSVVSAPKVRGTLSGVAGSGASDVWAVGSRANGKSLIEHWNGSSWTVVPSPNLPGGSVLVGVAVAPTTSSPTDRTAQDAWAIGSSGGNGHPTQPLIVHWNGHRWSVQDVPSVGDAADLASVAIKISSSHRCHPLCERSTVQLRVFAAGSSINSDGCLRTLVLRSLGNGDWGRMKTPNPFKCDNELAGIAATSKAVVAVGNHPVDCRGNACRDVTLALAFNGGRWRVQSSASASAKLNQLFGVALVPRRREAWAVGGASNAFEP
jgi:hypothetical protein